MALVTVSLGSNIDAETHIRQALDLLQQQFAPMTISPVYQTEAVGFDGDDFLNLVVSFESEWPAEQLSQAFKSIEDKLGRDRSQPRFTARLIDLDLLTIGQCVIDTAGLKVPRPEILKNAFVLKPLSDIHGELEHPLTGQTYAEHWRAMQPNAGRIEIFPMTF